MELQFQKTKMNCLGRAIREVQNTELTQEVRLTDGMPDIGRVLASWGQVIIRSKEWRGGQVSVSGGVMVWILYAPEDGSEARSIDAWVPFQIKWDLPDIDRDGPVRIFPLLRFVDSRTVSARKMMVRIGVGAMAEALYPMETEIYSPEELPEDVQVLRRTYPVRLPKEAGEKTFLLDEDLTLPASSPAPEKILCFTIQPEISDKKVMANKVVFRGAGNLHVIYRCAEGSIHSGDFELPFSQFAELEGEYGPDAQTDIQMGVTSLELDLNEAGQLRLKCGLVSQHLVDERVLLELTQDAYSPFRRVEPREETVQLPVMLDQRFDHVTAEQAVSGQTGEVLDVTFLPDFPRQHRTADGAQMELPGMFQVLYRGEDGAMQSAIARWEGRVELPAGEESRMDAVAQPIGRPQAMAGPDGISMNGQVRLTTDTSTDRGLSMVTGLELGELQEPDPSRPSLILCRPGSEELWDIAKRCGSTVAAIQRANGLQDDAVGDRILLIPVS